MGRNKKLDTIKVNSKVSLRKTSQSPYYQAYFRLDGRTYRPSTGTNDIDAAKDKALDLYVEARTNPKPKHQPISFQKCADSYLAAIQHDGKHGYHSDTMKRHLLPYFGSYGDLTRIKTADIDNYVAHRRSTTGKSPKPGTVNRENTVLRQMLAYAVRQGWIDKAPEIPHLSESQTRERRPHFTLAECQRLRAASNKRMAQARNTPQLRHTLASRELLNDVVLFLANSGLRVDEMKSVTWRSVELVEPQLKGAVQLSSAGKMRSNRRVALKKTAVKALVRIRDRRLAWLKANGVPQVIPLSEPVFALPDGTKVNNYKRGFSALLKAAGIGVAKGQISHSLTSLRHTYATYALTNPDQSKRVTTKVLALHMGTSIRMIEMHYGHDELSDYEDQLTA